MDELITLRTMRSEAEEPDARRLSPAFERLERKMAGASARRRPARARWVLVAVGTTAAAAIVIGQVSVTVQSAQAAEVLHIAAGQTGRLADPVPGPGQYLLVRTHADWGVSEQDDSGNDTFHMNLQTIDIYVPADDDQEWVLDRDWGESGERELIRANDGAFYGSPWLSTDLDALPSDGQSLLDHFNSEYNGGSASRDEDNFVRILDLLRTGLVPANLRAGLYEALALIPNVTIGDRQANLDGRTGIAIGRTEPLRGGMRQEIIIDPETGLVIGERDVMTVAAFGFGINQVIGWTAVETTVVDSAP